MANQRDTSGIWTGLALFFSGLVGLGGWWQIRTLREENANLKEQLKGLPSATPAVPQRTNTRGSYS